MFLAVAFAQRVMLGLLQHRVRIAELIRCLPLRIEITVMCRAALRRRLLQKVSGLRSCTHEYKVNVSPKIMLRDLACEDVHDFYTL